MKFKFSLESLLKHRMNLEREAQREFYEAQAKANAILEEIQNMYLEIEGARVEIQKISQNHFNQIEEVNQRNQFIFLKKIQIINKKEEARELLSIVEEKKELLMEAVKNVKVIKNLKDKKFKEFVKIKNKKEQKNIDEISVIRYNHRSA